MSHETNFLLDRKGVKLQAIGFGRGQYDLAVHKDETKAYGTELS